MSAVAQPISYIYGSGNLQPETNYTSEKRFMKSAADFTIRVVLLDQKTNEDIQKNYE
jgi:hypothetical protein